MGYRLVNSSMSVMSALGRAALLCALCVSCAANPELTKARDLGAKSLECVPQASDAKLEQDHGSWRMYIVECDLLVVRVECFDTQPCEIHSEKRLPNREPML